MLFLDFEANECIKYSSLVETYKNGAIGEKGAGEGEGEGGGGGEAKGNWQYAIGKR